MTNPHCKQGAFDPETGSVRYICRLHCGASLASAKVDFVMIMVVVGDFVMMMMIMVDIVMMMIMVDFVIIIVILVVVVHRIISTVTLYMTCVFHKEKYKYL